VAKKLAAFSGLWPRRSIQLRRTRVAMSDGLLHVLDWAPFSSAVVSTAAVMKVARIECAE
jgi:membrane protein required for beta-lactamase induction